MEMTLTLCLNISSVYYPGVLFRVLDINKKRKVLDKLMEAAWADMQKLKELGIPRSPAMVKETKNRRI